MSSYKLSEMMCIYRSGDYPTSCLLAIWKTCILYYLKYLFPFITLLIYFVQHENKVHLFKKSDQIKRFQEYLKHRLLTLLCPTSLRTIFFILTLRYFWLVCIQFRTKDTAKCILKKNFSIRWRNKSLTPNLKLLCTP